MEIILHVLAPFSLVQSGVSGLVRDNYNIVIQRPIEYSEEEIETLNIMTCIRNIRKNYPNPNGIRFCIVVWE